MFVPYTGGGGLNVRLCHMDIDRNIPIVIRILLLLFTSLHLFAPRENQMSVAFVHLDFMARSEKFAASDRAVSPHRRVGILDRRIGSESLVGRVIGLQSLSVRGLRRVTIGKLLGGRGEQRLSERLSCIVGKCTHWIRIGRILGICLVAVHMHVGRRAARWVDGRRP